MPPKSTKRIRPDAFDMLNWPVQPGDYHIFHAKKPVAVVMLSGVDYEDCHRPEVSSHIAITGSLSTENLGIEHLVKNVIANPFIRHVMVWGSDVKGHFPGDAILNLRAYGVDSKQRIINARGGRPVLKNLVRTEIDHFRKQIEAHDLRGNIEFETLKNQLRRLNRLERQPYEAGLTVDWIEAVRAEPAKRLKLDPSGYFVIMVRKGKPYPLLVEHYSNGGRLKNIVEGKDAATICSTLIEMKLISQTDHAAYVGRELAKAEMSLQSGPKYVQDRAQGQIM